MNKAPAFQFYPKDYLSDIRVRRMSLEHRGAYIDLLCTQWLEGSIPADLDELAELCGVPRSRMTRLWEKLSACFVACPDRADRLVNPRLEREREGQAARRAERAASGRRGAEGRWLSHDSVIAQPSVADSSAIAQPSESTQKSPKARRIVATAETTRTNDWNPAVVEVFNHWKQIMAVESPLDAKTKSIVRARLVEGFSVDDLKAAVDGCKASPWHMGANPEKKLVNDITTICRDGGQVRRFRDAAKATTPARVVDELPYFLRPDVIAQEEAAVAERVARKATAEAR